MSYTDSITYKQKILKILYQNKEAELLQNKNMFQITKVLATTPMTFKELIQALREYDNTITDHIVSESLNKLEEVELVTKVGERVFSTDDNKTEPLYLKSARLFIDIIFRSSYEHRVKRVDMKPDFVRTLGNLLGTQYKGKTLNEERFKEFLVNILTSVEENLIHLLENGEEEDLQRLFKEFNLEERNGLMNYMSWIIFWKERQMAATELDECYE